MGASIYRGNVEQLEDHEPYRDGECVALVQAVTTVGMTVGWRHGPRVADLSYLNPGTVIANLSMAAFRTGIGIMLRCSSALGAAAAAR